MSIAIAISTRNRERAFFRCLESWEFYLPNDAKIFVVDDCSEPIYFDSDFRFTENVGIPRVKNKCLELAYNSGAEHIFLADDDVYPISHEWHEPYINSGINHLCYTFTERFRDIPERPKAKIYGKFKSHYLPNGCLMYFTRKCIDEVGGFDTRFGLGGFEHVDLTRRIHNAGLTPFKNMDVHGSEKLFHSMDRNGEIERSIPKDIKDKLIKDGMKLFNEKRNDATYIEFR